MNHKAIHQLFVNQLIAEQLITTINISAKALRPEVKEWLLEVLQSKDISNPELWYKEECIK
jgi:hemerythrin